MDRASSSEPGVESAPRPNPRPELLSRLAHELRSPISAIVSAADVMAQQRLGALANPQYLAYAENIAASGRHALAVIERVLDDWDRMDATANLDFVELDLNGLVERTVSVLRPLLRERGHQIVTHLQDRLPHVIADATSLRQILLNLLNNAAKYAIEGSDVTVSTTYELAGPVVLMVSDPGPGMSPEAIATALSDRPASPSVQSGGLGLPLVRRLAAANGATFAIDSTTGSATTISISFPNNKVVPV